jgi:hypothetical protein
MQSQAASQQKAFEQIQAHNRGLGQDAAAINAAIEAREEEWVTFCEQVQRENNDSIARLQARTEELQGRLTVQQDAFRHVFQAPDMRQLFETFGLRPPVRAARGADSVSFDEVRSRHTYAASSVRRMCGSCATKAHMPQCAVALQVVSIGESTVLEESSEFSIVRTEVRGGENDEEKYQGAGAASGR